MRTLGFASFLLVFNAMAPTPATPPTQEVDALAPLVVVREDPFPCLDIQRRARERLACARLGCVCRGD